MNKPTRVLLFGPDLFGPTISGDKQITLRRYREDAHMFTEGEVFIGEFREGYRLLLEATKTTEVKPFREITDGEAQEDGFDNAAHAFEAMKGVYYTDLTQDSLMGIIRYRILEIEGVPVFEQLEE